MADSHEAPVSAGGPLYEEDGTGEKVTRLWAREQPQRSEEEDFWQDGESEELGEQSSTELTKRILQRFNRPELAEALGVGDEGLGETRIGAPEPPHLEEQGQQQRFGERLSQIFDGTKSFGDSVLSISSSVRSFEQELEALQKEHQALDGKLHVLNAELALQKAAVQESLGNLLEPQVLFVYLHCCLFVGL